MSLFIAKLFLIVALAISSLVHTGGSATTVATHSTLRDTPLDFPIAHP